MSGEPAAWVEIALPLPIGQTYTYSLDALQRRRARPGSRARVPVGKRRMIGFVAGFPERPPDGIETRPIAALLDREPPFPDDLLELAGFAASYYLAPLGELLAAMAPPESVAWGERRLRLTDGGALAPPRDAAEGAIRDRLLESGRVALSELESEIDPEAFDLAVARGLADGRWVLEERSGSGSRYATAVELAPAAVDELRSRCGRSPAGRAVVDFLVALGRPALASEVEAGVACGPAVLRRLVTLGVLRRFTQPEALSLDRHLLPRDEGRPAIVLRDDQSGALARIVEAIAGGEFRRLLLQGMTGSG
jgi:primosomal protein N' (replication factor Y)